MSEISDIVRDLMPLSKLRDDGFVSPVILEYFELKDHGYTHQDAVEKMQKHYQQTYGVPK